MVRIKATQLKKENGELTINDEEAAVELCRSFKEVFTIKDVNSVIEDDRTMWNNNVINFRIWNSQ